MKNNRIMIIAGEASGEQHGAELVRALQKINPAYYFYGTGGRRMREANVEIIVDCAELAVMGFGDVVKHIPQLWRIYRTLKKVLQNDPPDLLILIDYPGFNLRLAALAKKLGIKVLFYISPQVWAWRQGRVKKIAKVVDHLAVIFPFEEIFYRQVNLPVTYVGHPLTKVVKPCLTVREMKEKYNIPEHAPVVGLLPGSRQIEVKRLLHAILAAAKKIHQAAPQTEFVLPLASTITHAMLAPYLKACALPIHLIENYTYDAMNCCDALILSSGTATLEAALLAKPMVIIYKVPPMAAMLLKRLIKIEHIGLANIIAGKRIVPELLQEHANPTEISTAILKILNDTDYRNNMVGELEKVRHQLGDLDGSENVAKIAASMLNN